jgi:hypothetical protein
MARYRHGLAVVLFFWGLLASAQAQWYHAQLFSEEGDPIPFFLRLPEDCKTESATIVNGPESIPTECERSEAGFTLDFPIYEARIDARFDADGSARGVWVVALRRDDEDSYNQRVRAFAVNQREPEMP